MIKLFMDIQQNIHLIEQHFEMWGIEKSHIIKDEMNRQIISQSLSAIRKALKDLPEGFLDRFSEVPWVATILQWEELLESEIESELSLVWDEILYYLPQLSSMVKEIFIYLSIE